MLVGPTRLGSVKQGDFPTCSGFVGPFRARLSYDRRGGSSRGWARKARLDCIHHLLRQIPYEGITRPPVVSAAAITESRLPPSFYTEGHVRAGDILKRRHRPTAMANVLEPYGAVVALDGRDTAFALGPTSRSMNSRVSLLRLYARVRCRVRSEARASQRRRNAGPWPPDLSTMDGPRIPAR